MMRRALALIRTPEQAWRAIAAEAESPTRVFRRLLPLSLIPACAWMIGLAAFGSDLTRDGEAPIVRSVAQLLHAGFVTLLGSWFTVAAFAASLAAVAPMYGRRRSWADAWRVAAYGATPVWLAGALLVKPVLILVVLVALLQAAYLYYLGLQAVAGVAPGDAAEYVGIAGFLTIALSIPAGGFLSFLQLL